MGFKCVFLYLIRLALFWFMIFNSHSLAFHQPPVKSQFLSPEESVLGIGWLKETVRKKNLKTVEQVLDVLPESYLKGYTLVHSSKSLQGASFMNPRAIVFGNDGHFIITFNGHPDQKGFHTLEMVEQNPHGQLEFVEASFDPEENIVSFSQPNPRKCMQCHASFPRPVGFPKYIWPSYNQWSGAYGQKDDDIAEHYEQYMAFKKSAENHPRYQYLDPGPTDTFPYYHDIRVHPYGLAPPEIRHFGSMPNHRV